MLFDAVMPVFEGRFHLKITGIPLAFLVERHLTIDRPKT